MGRYGSRHVKYSKKKEKEKKRSKRSDLNVLTQLKYNNNVDTDFVLPEMGIPSQ